MASIDLSAISFNLDERFTFGSLTFAAGADGKIQLSGQEAPRVGRIRSDLAADPHQSVSELVSIMKPLGIAQFRQAGNNTCSVCIEARAVNAILHLCEEEDEESILLII